MKKAGCALGERQRGRLTSVSERTQYVKASGARLSLDCEEAGISLCTYRRWSQDGKVLADKRLRGIKCRRHWKLQGLGKCSAETSPIYLALYVGNFIIGTCSKTCSVAKSLAMTFMSRSPVNSLLIYYNAHCCVKTAYTGLIMHSDNGAPMKSQTMRAKAYELGVTTSCSRPRVSNNNPFVQSQFRTCKNRPELPLSGFKSLVETRQWVLKFTRWYNCEHKHSHLNFVTPLPCHTGQDKVILAQRKMCMEAAKAANQSRWGKRDVRNYEPVGPTTLNPEKKPVKQKEQQAA